MGEPIEPPPRPRLLAARQFHRDRHTSARRRGLLQVGKFEVVVSLGQHDLLQNALESRPHRSKLLRLLGGEGRPDFGDEVVDRPRRRAVLQGLDGVEEPEVEDVEVGAVERLADELDVPTISGALPDDVRVVVQVVRWSVVVLGPDGLPPSCARPIALDRGNHILYQLFLVPLLRDLHTLGFACSCRSASAVTHRLPHFSEWEDLSLIHI